jgi:hypothetical protein
VSQSSSSSLPKKVDRTSKPSTVERPTQTSRGVEAAPVSSQPQHQQQQLNQTASIPPATAQNSNRDVGPDKSAAEVSPPQLKPTSSAASLSSSSSRGPAPSRSCTVL